MENYTPDCKGYYKCPTCGKPFYSKVVLKVHIKKGQCFNPHQVSQENSSVIENVSKQDSYAKNVENSVKSAKNTFSTMLGTTNIPIQSKICKEQTVEYEKLKSRHCQECNKTFRRKRYLPIHINVVHKNIKKFQCLQCPKAFGINATLQQHILAVHEKITPFQCHKCTKTFGQNSNLQTHIKTVHKDVHPQTSRVLMCPLDPMEKQ